MQSINASEFKAKCLAILDEVSETGESIIILKRGKPVAQLIPPMGSNAEFPQDDLHGTVIFHGNVLDPVLPPGAWEATEGRLE